MVKLFSPVFAFNSTLGICHLESGVFSGLSPVSRVIEQLGFTDSILEVYRTWE